MSEAFYDLIGKASFFLPTEDKARSIFQQYSMLDAHAVLKAIKKIPAISSSFLTLPGLVSDMDRVELEKVFIHLVDTYYPQLIQEIADDDKSAKLFVEVIKLIIDELKPEGS
jgi:hypothetical protein